LELSNLDTKLKKAMILIGESVEPRANSFRDIRAWGERRRHCRLRQITILAPVAAIVLFFLVTAFPVFAGGENLYQWWAGRELSGAAQGWTAFSPDDQAWQSLGIDPQEVSVLADQGLGRGEIAILEVLATLSGRTADDLLVLREQGLGWGKIAAILGVDWYQARELLTHPPGGMNQGTPGSPAGQPGENSTWTPTATGTPSASQTPSVTETSTGMQEREQELEQQREQQSEPSPQEQERQREQEQEQQENGPGTFSGSPNSPSAAPQNPTATPSDSFPTVPPSTTSATATQSGPVASLTPSGPSSPIPSQTPSGPNSPTGTPSGSGGPAEKPSPTPTSSSPPQPPHPPTGPVSNPSPHKP
jgi:hypothetical protein